METGLSCNISIHEEKIEGKNVFVVECDEIGISDFGESISEATDNLRKAINLLLEVAPEKKNLLLKPRSLMFSRLFL